MTQKKETSYCIGNGPDRFIQELEDLVSSAKESVDGLAEKEAWRQMYLTCQDIAILIQNMPDEAGSPSALALGSSHQVIKEERHE